MTRAGHLRTVLQLVTSSAKSHRRLLVEVVLWSLVEALPTFLSGRLIALALDRGFLATRPAIGFAWLAVLAASVPVGAWGTRQTYHRLAQIVEPLRDELAVRTVQGALHHSIAPGASPDNAGVARLTQHVEIVREAYANVLIVVQGFVISTLSALLGLATLAPAALVLVVPPLIVALAIFTMVLVRMASQQRASILANERIAESAAVVTSGLRDVVACGGEEIVHATVGRHIDDQASATMELARLTAARSSAIAVGGLLPVLLILFSGSWLFREGASTGAVVGALTYVLQGVHPALQSLVRELGNTGLWLFVAASRILEATELTKKEDKIDLAVNGHADPTHDVELRSVTFRYGPWADPVFSRLDLTIPEGDYLVVIGPSGVGKSTLAGVIAGLLEPETGEVLIGGLPTRHMDSPTLARRRVLIPQEAYVFGGTLRENLTYYRSDATNGDIEDAVVQFDAASLLERVGGLDADVHRTALSAGQLQLITLIRAYLSPASLVILDEASCHLDQVAEAVAERAFAQRPGTLVVIAHRMSSALRARRVLVMDGKEIVLGTVEYLQERSALYRSLLGYWD